jgi:hypothetical protein
MVDCYRCGESVQNPVEQHGAYVEGDDMAVSETTEVTEAVVQTDETRNALQSLQSNHYPNSSLDTLERAVVSSTDLISYLGVPLADPANDVAVREDNAKAAAPAVADFDRVEIPDVADAPEGTVKVERKTVTRDVQKRGVVCPDCMQDADTILWGVEP